ncbi:MAG: replicative DNA helicase [Actinomycetota bacterium]|nr:replicative DNA helicase [Actinomycetota bacterium]
MSAPGREHRVEEGEGNAAERLRDVGLEREILGAMIANAASAEEIVDAGVTKEDFWGDSHRVVYSALHSLRNDGEHVDRHTLRERLERSGSLDDAGTPEDLAALQAAASPPDAVRAHARILRDLGRKRAVMRIADEMRLTAKGGKLTGDEVVAHGEGLLRELDPTDASGEADDAEAGALKALSASQEAYGSEGGVLGVRTGIKDLDAILLGLRKGTINLLAARPSMGKTALALQIARSAARGAEAKGDDAGTPGVPALVFSLEMRTAAIWTRHLASESRIDSKRLGAGNVYDDEWAALIEAVNTASKLPIYTDDSSGLTVSGIRSRSRRLARRLAKQGTPLGLIVVDYVGLLTPEGPQADRRLEIAVMSRTLKALAKDLDVPVLLLAQLNRSCEARNDKRPLLSDLRESGDLEQDADTVTMIYRDDYYNPDSEDKGVAELLVRKNREGDTGVARATWLAQHQYFGDLSRRDENATRGQENVPTFARRRPASTS